MENLIPMESLSLETAIENMKEKLIEIMALLAGMLGIAAAGGVLPAGTDTLTSYAAVAVPGLLAWLISYLVFNTEQPAEEPESMEE